MERVIGNVRRKYTVLQRTLPIDYLKKSEDATHTTIDKIVTACCALTNICDSVVPFNYIIGLGVGFEPTAAFPEQKQQDAE